MEGFENLSWYTRADSISQQRPTTNSWKIMQSAFVWHLESMEPHLASSVSRDLEYQLIKSVFLWDPVMQFEHGKGVWEVKPEAKSPLNFAISLFTISSVKKYDIY